LLTSLVHSGPYNYQSEIVEHLDNAGAAGTFFLNGNNCMQSFQILTSISNFVAFLDDCIYDKADELIASYNAGHIMASHTWSHADITKLSASDLNEELRKVEVAMKKILGIKPKLFRPPYGNFNDDALRVLHDRGYSSQSSHNISSAPY
jgi:peptidoglycan/xylan/chitin deacetylase (PgdA/CDA1 family)